MMSVLIVEDEAAIGRLVADQLANRGMVPTVCASLEAATDAVRRQSFDVVILDLSLPDGSGLDVLRDLRRTGSTAHVIVLSGASSELDRVQALGLGADDYVVKPFFARELAARVLAVQRRRDPGEDKRLRAGHLEIDIDARTVTAAGSQVELTSKEFDLLAFLAARPGHVFSRDDLLRSVWHSAAEWQQASTVTEHMRRIRSKLEKDPALPQLLQTVRGAGYRFDTPADDLPVTQAEAGSEPKTGTLVHVDGCIVAADRGAVTICGWEEGELVGKSITELVAPESLEALHAALKALTAGQKSRSQLFTLARADGGLVTVGATGTPTVWNGRPARQATITPMSDASSRLRHLVTGVVTEVSEAVIITDSHFHIRSWNRAAERLYGWGEGEVLGRHVVDILPWVADERDLTAAYETLEATGRWHGEVVHLTREGTPVRVHGTTTVVRGDEGEVVAVVAINRASASTMVPDHVIGTGQGDKNEVLRAIEDHQLVVLYQPLVSLDTGEVIGLEGLIRWNHPDRGLLGPDDFMIEGNGLTGELGRLTLELACKEGVSWDQAGVEMDVGVNLLRGELVDPHLANRVLETLSSTGLSPHRLWLSMTETALVEDLDHASATLRHLADLGVRLSIGDFGTGWPSLTYLKQLPVHALRIDRTFVKSIVHNVNDVASVRSILQLGAELGLAVVAQGIESATQETALRDLGCTIGQGSLYGAPTSAADLAGRRSLPVTRPRGLSAGPPRIASVDLAPTAPLPHPGAQHPGDIVQLMITDIETSALRGLLRIRSADGAVDLLQLTARRLGAVLVPADEAGADALPIDLSLGEGPPLLAVVDPLSPARMALEQILPRLVEDARRAVDLLRQTERLDDESNHDKLTGLANRRVLERVLSRAGDGTVVMIDLDHFKAINDTLGHAAGDAVLAQFGRTLSVEVRVGDTPCRLGGDEFVVIASGLDEAGSYELVERIRAAWALEAPHPVTFSAGLASINESGGTSALLAADRALYRGKQLGRDRTEMQATPSKLEAQL